MIIQNKIISKNWSKYFLQINFVLFLLIFSANSISSLLRSNITYTDIALNQLFTMPDIFLITIPVSCLLTSIILVNKLINTSELTAIYSLGFSPSKFAAIILRLSFFSFLLAFFITGYVQPKLLEIKSDKFTFLESKFRKLKKQGLISSKIANGKMWYKSDKSFFNYSTYNQQTNKLSKIESFQIKNNKVESVSFSNFLKYENGSNWSGGKILSVENITSNEFLNSDFDFNQKTITLSLQEKNIKNLEKDILSLNVLKFKRYIDQLDRDGVSSIRYKVLFWQKISISLSCIVFSIIGLMGLTNSNKRSQTMGASIGLTFVIVLSYWFLDSFLIELGKNAKINLYLSTFGSLLVAITLLVGTRIKQIINEF